MLGKEGQVCFEVTAQAWRRLSNSVDATRGRGAHRRVRVHQANEEPLHGAVDGDDGQWQAQDGPGLTRAPPMSAQEAWKQLRLARYRVPAPETMDVYVDSGEGHDCTLPQLAVIKLPLSQRRDQWLCVDGNRLTKRQEVQLLL